MDTVKYGLFTDFLNLMEYIQYTKVVLCLYIVENYAAYQKNINNGVESAHIIGKKCFTFRNITHQKGSLLC